MKKRKEESDLKKTESFNALGLSQEAINAIEEKGFVEPTPIQKKVIPAMLRGTKDIIGQAKTGTGKTAAFGLAIMERLEKRDGIPQALIVVPTRELALQVCEELNSLRGDRGFRIISVYGGQSYDTQFKQLKKGVEIVVGTPGRLIDHIHRGTLNIGSIGYLVLDEADEMLNMGFIEEMEEIIKNTPADKRVLLFSATMPRPILSIARRYMGDYEHFVEEEKQLTVNTTEQIYFEVNEGDKVEVLCRTIDLERDFYGLIFCKTKVDVDELTQKLIERGYDAECLHGDIAQYQRERIMEKFRKRRIRILVATDVAARGIDVADLTHVINFSLPQDPEAYVHRIGRTGRAGKEGTAITFVTPEEYRKLSFIKKITRTEIKKEKIPPVKKVIESKKARIQEQVEAILQDTDLNDYLELSKRILGDRDPETVLAAVLKHSFGEQLDESAYRHIQEVTYRKPSKTRLFFAQGRTNGMTPKKLVQLIRTKTGVEDRKIREIEILEKFSFLTVAHEDAELILATFRDKGKKQLVSVARERTAS
ncbi:MAG TPA: DEAD/DEAH box helicase [Thermotogota bacterium]|nr:MAG: DEAD-box ATP-dependent RNA helicase CshA [Thermotogota bacterium ADurb.Bin062]HOD91891.1 DEAD/DEAH box helicase [Thermotogota bacterium]HPG99112.1 DEAD/DEAH box helicase [Thermotogota bacterium]HPL39720.1 DEAD/DEAH box helicase [Thermotogota bacterium]HRS81510.1 DEAD/DEAH box helicase [Thermotogota bacterium]